MKFCQALQAISNAKIQNQTSMTPNSVFFPPNCTIAKTKGSIKPVDDLALKVKIPTSQANVTNFSRTWADALSRLTLRPSSKWKRQAQGYSTSYKSSQTRLNAKRPRGREEVCAEVALRRSSCHGNTKPPQAPVPATRGVIINVLGRHGDGMSCLSKTIRTEN